MPETTGEDQQPPVETALLQRRLGLRDVYAISTGAMLSSGLFLLPGLAAAEAGPAVVLAYLMAGLMVVPAMLSTAELASAMPRSGGVYYFAQRSLGPLAATIAGVGTWVTLVFKSAFSFVGIGAYLSIYMDVPVEAVAIALTVVLVSVNAIGAKQTSRLEIALVALLLGVLGYFLTAGFVDLLGTGAGEVRQDQYSPFMPFGVGGVLAATGMVFVSYAGLTQIAAIGGEIRNPGRNIPLGMLLSLATVLIIYVAGVATIVGVLDAEELRDDLTPVATAAETFMPLPLGLALVVAAALAAFLSTGNAGILTSSRFLFALGSDGVLWGRLAHLTRRRNPAVAVLVTGLVIALFIVAFDIESIAKLASSFMLLILAMINLMVITLRLSGNTYQPGFRAPLSPWLQIVGIVFSAVLIYEIGLLGMLFTSGLVAACVAWYVFYVRGRVESDSALSAVWLRFRG